MIRPVSQERLHQLLTIEAQASTLLAFADEGRPIGVQLEVLRERLAA